MENRLKFHRLTDETSFLLATHCPFDGAAFHEAQRCLTCGAPQPKVLVSDSQNLAILKASNNCVVLHPDQSGNVKPVFWRKVLYIRQPFPDNFTDHEQFLDYLTKTVRPPYKHRELMLQTVFMIQPICMVAIYVAVWRAMHSKVLLNADTLLLLDCCLFVVGYSAHLYLDKESRGKIRATAKRVVVMIASLKVLCPVLQTLIRSFSDDTVVLLTTIMFGVHLAAFDYSYITRPEEKLFGGVALNAAMFGTVLLASRLEEAHEVYAFLLFGVLTFSLSLIIRRRVHHWNPAWHNYGFTIVLIAVAVLMLESVVVPRIVTQIFVAGIMTIVVGGPVLFIRSQKYKNDLRGPWDLPSVQAYH